MNIDKNVTTYATRACAAIAALMLCILPMAAQTADVRTERTDILFMETKGTFLDTIQPEPSGQPHDIRLKTNGVAWLMLVPNAAVEFDLSRRWSFNFPIYYSFFNYFTRTLKFRTLCVQPEMRLWFKDGHSGFFAGAHFGVGYYNYALGKGHYRIQDKNRHTPAWGGGLTAGYRMPLKKNSRWDMEFSIGAGVYDVCYDRWVNRRHGKRVAKGIHKTYYGLDHFGVSISYRFDSE